MRHVSIRVAWVVFCISAAALLAIAVAVDAMATRFVSSEKWEAHTRDVENQLAQLRANLASAEAARLSYVLTGEPANLELYSQAAGKTPEEIARLRELTSDNPFEQNNMDLLGPLVNQRIGLLRESIELRQNGKSDEQQQIHMTAAERDIAASIAGVMTRMQDEEEALLSRRQTISERGYARLRTLLRVGLAVAILLLIANLLSLTTELRERKRAEDAVRRLSGHILRVQDEERRKIARELHDSLGQLLAAVKMNLNGLENDDVISNPAEREKLLSECMQLLEQGSKETRTLSYLLHPPLLDDLGFASAAKWYVEGFSQRSKIQVNLNLMDETRMASDVELALFRVLQESLTNIHRYAGSATADIRLERKQGNAILTIEDHGCGMSTALLERFRNQSAGAGVGLAGMQERVRELGGNLKVLSEGHGTIVQVTVPLSELGKSGTSKERLSAQEVPTT